MPDKSDKNFCLSQSDRHQRRHRERMRDPRFAFWYWIALLRFTVGAYWRKHTPWGRSA